MSEKVQKSKRGIRLLKRMGITLAVFVLLLLSLSLIVHIPFVQKWGIGRITGYLSQKTGSEVTVGSFGFNIFRSVSLRDVYIAQQDFPADTLLYAGTLDVRFSRIWSILRDEVHIRNISLRHARLVIDESMPFNFENLATSTQPRQGPTRLRFSSLIIALHDVSLEIKPDNSGLYQRHDLPDGMIRVDHIDFGSKDVAVRHVHLLQPATLLLDDGNGRRERSVVTRDSMLWKFTVDAFEINQGNFRLQQPSKTQNSTINGVDYTDLEIRDLMLKLQSVMIDGSSVLTEIRDLSFEEKSGFRVEGITADAARIAQHEIVMSGVRINTPGSTIGDSIALTFEDYGAFADFADNVHLYARFTETQIHVRDLLLTIPGFYHSTFFTHNRDEQIKLHGILSGRLSRLRGDDFALQLGNATFAGSFRTRNITMPGEQLLNLDVSEVYFDPADLERHIPGLSVPPQFRKLGKIRFDGRFDGFLEDFVAYGRARTDLGMVELDMNLHTSSGGEPRYSGQISLVQFDLQHWTDNPDFGYVSANLVVREGRGLTAQTASAQLAGRIYDFTYKDYIYADINLDGNVERNRFDGAAQIHDPNADLVFQGSIQITEDRIPEFDFTADITKLDLHALHLVKDMLVISGEFAVHGQGKDINTITGSGTALGIVITRGQDVFHLDSVSVDVVDLPDTMGSYVIVASDYIDGWFRGDFAFNALYPAIARSLKTSHPRYFSELKYNEDLSQLKQQVEFEMTLNHPREWSSLFGIKDLHFVDFRAHGIFDLDQDTVMIQWSAPQLHYGKANAYRAAGVVRSHGGVTAADVAITVIDFDETFFFDVVEASLHITDEVITWRFSTDDLLEALNTVDLSGTFQPGLDGSYKLHLDPEIIEIHEQTWELRPGNEIIFGKDFIALNDVVFQQGDRMIRITDIDRRGLVLETRDFSLDAINTVWDYDKLDFQGAYTLRAGVRDFFARKDFFLTVNAASVEVNETSYGSLAVEGTMDSLGAPVRMTVGLERPGSNVYLGSLYFPPFKEVTEHLRHQLDMNVMVDTFPVAFLEYFLGDGVQHTEGYMLGNMKVTGDAREPQMEGSLRLLDGATTVTYLGTRYFFHDQTARIDAFNIDASGVVITDIAGNTASVQGGLTHRYLGNLGLNARIQSRRFIGLNTTKDDNQAYYGTGIGALDVRFTGSVERPAIAVDAVTGPGTSVVLNIAREGDAGRESFIRFRSDLLAAGHSHTRGQAPATGVQFDMNLTATPTALVEIILEEDPPESIIGSGSGNIRLSVTRAGDISIYGSYEIDQGHYVFRSFLVINKPFDLRQGGTIQWRGDPFNALINIEADYIGLRTSLSTFIAEYLVNASREAQQDARQKTDVLLRLILTGTLLQPEINFDFSFPALSGEVAGYADARLRILKADQNAMNEQVFGLLWAGSFLPSNVLSSSSLGLARQGISNTLSEFASNQLSSLLSGILRQAFAGVDFISDIDLNVGYSPESTRFDPTDATASYEEWELRLKNRLFNDRFIIDVGGNYIADSPLETGAYFAGDYALEYILTADRRLKVRVYHRNELTIEGRKNKVGIGLAWRREFDSIGEWFEGLKRQADRMQEDDDGVRVQ